MNKRQCQKYQKYKKLVRDKIPAIINAKGEIPKIHIANNQEYWQKLKEKLLEETDEFSKEKKTSKIQQELADILEVIDAICEFKKISKKTLIEVKAKKKKQRGSFKKRIILDYVAK